MENEQIVKRNIFVDILVIIFGLGTWIGVNGTFVQLPSLVKISPESWSLPSYMSITIQLANIGPILYVSFRKFQSKCLNDVYLIFSLLLINFIALILTAFFHDYHTEFAGESRSIALFILTFFPAITGCISSVLFYPYMRHFKEIYFISFFIGEGLSGFIPSIFALIQGIGSNPKCTAIDDSNGTITLEPIFDEPIFDTSVFFLIISIFSFISFIAFILLINLNLCKNERVYDEDKTPDIIEHEMKPANHIDDTIVETFNKPSQVQRIVFLIVITIVYSLLNGIFPSITTFSCLPYGNLAYHLVVTLASMASPVACFLAYFFSHTSNRTMSILISLSAVITAYLITTSLLSPSPPLVKTDAGIVIVVLSWIAAIGLLNYIKLCIYTIIRTHGGSWIFYCGAFSQLGATIGSLLSFYLINYTNIFVSSSYC